MNAYELADALYSPFKQTKGYYKTVEESAIMLRQQAKRIEELESQSKYVRLPKVGDRVECIEDGSLATVQSLTGGGSPDIKFDDGSHGTYMVHEFNELFRYVNPEIKPVLYAPPHAFAEKYAEIDTVVCRRDSNYNYTIPLYTHPHKELSDEEIWKIYNITGLGNGMAVRFARAIIKASRGEE